MIQRFLFTVAHVIVAHVIVDDVSDSDQFVKQIHMQFSTSMKLYLTG